MCNSLGSKVIPEVSIAVFYVVDVPATREAEPPGRSASLTRLCLHLLARAPHPWIRTPLAVVPVQTWFSLFSLFGFVCFFFFSFRTV